MKILYIADADEGSYTAGSVRGRAIKSFIESRYSLEYMSLSVINPALARRVDPPVHRRVLRLWVFKPLGINRSFRSVDSSMFRAIFYLNLWNMLRSGRHAREIDLIYCSYKPASAIWLGLVAKLLYKAPLVVEYRDLMSVFGDRDLSTLWRRALNSFDQKVESFLLKFIDRVIVVNHTQSREFYAAFGRESSVVMNGYDGLTNYQKLGDAYANFPPSLRIGYAGQLSKRRKLSCLSILDGSYTLELMSRENPYDFGLSPSIRCNEYGFLDKNQMNEVLGGCDCFLLIEGVQDSSKGNLPSKVFEYMRFCKPILFFGHPESEVALLLRKIGLLIAIPNDSVRVDLYSELKNVMRSFDPCFLPDYSREQQLNNLKRILDEYIIRA